METNVQTLVPQGGGTLPTQLQVCIAASNTKSIKYISNFWNTNKMKI